MSLSKGGESKADAVVGGVSQRPKYQERKANELGSSVAVRTLLGRSVFFFGCWWAVWLGWAEADSAEVMAWWRGVGTAELAAGAGCR